MARRTKEQAIAEAQRWVGTRVGRRVVEEIRGAELVPTGGYGGGWRWSYRFAVRCDCGALSEVVKSSPTHLTGKSCQACGQQRMSTGQFVGHGPAIRRWRREFILSLIELDPDIWTEDSPQGNAARAWVTRQLGPLNNAEIGLFEGVSRERIRQVQTRALEKLRVRAEAKRTPFERALGRTGTDG